MLDRHDGDSRLPLLQCRRLRTRHRPLHSKITVNPGAVTSKVSATNLYYPSSGAFGNKHFELWAINRGSIVGDVDTGNLPASSIDYVRSSRALNGTVLTVAVTLWVYLNPYGTYVADGAKTADATCRPSVTIRACTERRGGRRRPRHQAAVRSPLACSHRG